jgi:uncharacterized protein YutE (UPF0331/DUF86 family)
VVDREALAARLDALERYLVELRAFGARTRDEFVSSPALHHLAERYLHLACECVLDIAHHLISDLGLRQPTSYRDAMDVLREAGHLDAGLAERLKGWMGLRNILVHFYLEIDHGRVHEAIVEDLKELEDFLKSIAQLLKRPEGA